MQPVVLINGRVVGQDAATVSVFDRGFLLGDGVFETLRVYQGRALRLAAHLDRLSASAQSVGIELCDVGADVHTALATYGAHDGVLRLTVTRGAAAFGLDATHTPAPTRVVTLAPLPNFPAALYQDGICLGVAASTRHSDAVVPAHVKGTSYLGNVLTLLQAQRAGVDDAVFFNTHGEVTEATSANVFARIDNKWCTPPVSAGLLNGVTRMMTLELLGADGCERSLTLDDLLGAQAMVLTSSVREVVPIRLLRHAGGEHLLDVAFSRSLWRRYKTYVHSELT